MPCEGMVHIPVISAVMEFQGGTIPNYQPYWAGSSLMHGCTLYIKWECEQLEEQILVFQKSPVNYVPLNDLEVRIWCAKSVHKIKVPMLTNRTIHTNIYG